MASRLTTIFSEEELITMTLIADFLMEQTGEKETKYSYAMTFAETLIAATLYKDSPKLTSHIDKMREKYGKEQGDKFVGCILLELVRGTTDEDEIIQLLTEMEGSL